MSRKRIPEVYGNFRNFSKMTFFWSFFCPTLTRCSKKPIPTTFIFFLSKMQQILQRVFWYNKKRGSPYYFSRYKRKTKKISEFSSLIFAFKNSCTLQIGQKMSKPGFKSQRQAWRFIWYQNFCPSLITRALISFAKIQKMQFFGKNRHFST